MSRQFIVLIVISITKTHTQANVLITLSDGANKYNLSLEMEIIIPQKY